MFETKTKSNKSRSRSFTIGRTRLTVNLIPAGFLVFVLIAVLVIVFFAPADTAEIALTPAGILAIVAQAVMRQAFEVEALPESESASDAGKPEA